MYVAQEYFDKVVPMKELTSLQRMNYKNAKDCHICERKLAEIPPFMEAKIRRNEKKIEIFKNLAVYVGQKTLCETSFTLSG